MSKFKTIAGDYFISEGDLLSKKELAQALGKSLSTIVRWQREGMPYTAYSNNINGYNLKEVLDWIESKQKSIVIKRSKKL